MPSHPEELDSGRVTCGSADIVVADKADEQADTGGDEAAQQVVPGYRQRCETENREHEKGGWAEQQDDLLCDRQDENENNQTDDPAN